MDGYCVSIQDCRADAPICAIVVISLSHVLSYAAIKPKDGAESVPLQFTELASVIEPIDGRFIRSAQMSTCQPRWRGEHETTLHIVLHVTDFAVADYLIALKYKFVAKGTDDQPTAQPCLTLEAASRPRQTIQCRAGSTVQMIDSLTHNGRGIFFANCTSTTLERGKCEVFTVERLFEDDADAARPPFQTVKVLTSTLRNQCYVEPYSGAVVFAQRPRGSQPNTVIIQYFD